MKDEPSQNNIAAKDCQTRKPDSLSKNGKSNEGQLGMP